LVPHLVVFARDLRRAGVGVTSQQIALLVEALSHVGVQDRLAVRDAARATLAGSRDDVALVDAAFERFWRAGPASPRLDLPLPRVRTPTRLMPAAVAIAKRLGQQDEVPPQPLSDRARSWSASERLRHTRFDRLTEDEAEAVTRMMERIRLPPPERVTRRHRPAARGRALDWRRMVRGAVRHDGELVERRWRARQRKPRPLVVFADVSGSMERYSRMLLHFLHGLMQRSRRAPHRWTIDVFVFGTRLTRITRALQSRQVDAAMDAVSRRVVDWSGGTRIGESLHAFNREWGRRVLGRGAIVALISDGWDQGQPDLVAHEMARLHRSSRRVHWLNPLMGTAGYAPATAGLVAARPFIDAMLPAGDLSSLESSLLAMASDSTRAARRKRDEGATRAR
jgi:uncharacterized protein with von Willebrand factor type A (vWA) domain